MPEQAQLTGPTTDLHLFIPITRVDDEERICEGYAFVNETVEGEGGVRLLRSAMEAATSDYLRWGAVREMHQASAVGTALAEGCGIEWDEKGAKLRAKIVDDIAWKKVKEGVYRGFSLRAAPKLIRGKNVEKVSWIENSLVDRPKDPDCPITLWRMDEGGGEAAVIDRSAEAIKGYLVGLKDPGAEDESFIARVSELLDQSYEARTAREGDHPEMQVLTAAEVALAAHFARAQTSETVPARENLEGGPKGDTHYNCGQGSSSYCHGHTTRGGAQECQEKTTAAKAEHVAALEGHLAAMKAGQRGEGVGEALDFLRTRLTETYGEGPETEFLSRVLATLEEQEPPPDPDPPTEERAESALLSRFDEVLTRLGAAEAETAAVRGELTSAKEQIEALKREPADRHRPPVRFPQALERTFPTGELARDSAADQAVLDEWRQLSTGPAADDPEEQLRRVRRIQELKLEVYALGLLGRE